MDGKKVKPTPMQKSIYQDLAGHAARDLVKRATDVPKFKELSPEGQGEFLADHLGDIGKAVKTEVFKTQSKNRNIAVSNVLPKSKEVFEHNINVALEKEKAVKALDSDPKLKEFYSKLNDEQKEHADKSIGKLFGGLALKESPTAKPNETQADLRGKQADLKRALREVRDIVRDSGDYNPNDK